MFSNNEQKQIAYRMQVFAEVVRQGSFTLAAESLGHTKSAVSTYVSQLEALLDCRLLNRTTRKLKLTSVGEQFAKRSQELQALIKLAQSEVQEQQLQPHGRLRITAPHALGEYLLLPCLSTWHQRFPGYELDLQLTDQRLDLMQHDFDIALRVGALPDSSYRQISLGKLENVLVVSPRLYLKQDLKSISKLLLPWQNELQLLDEQGQPWIYAQQNVIKLNSVSSAITGACNGMGMAIVPRLFVSDKLQTGELVAIDKVTGLDSRPVSLLHAYERQLPLALRNLADSLKVAFQP